MKTVRFIVCMECSSDRDWEWYEYLQETGKVKQVLSEPCGNHSRTVVYHIPATPDDHVKVEALYALAGGDRP